MIPRERLTRILIYGLPAIVLLPVMLAPMPNVGSGSEIGTYFSSLAFVEEGIYAYTFHVPAESRVGLHIYALLSSPLVAIGIENGGRFIALFTAIICTLFVGRLGFLIGGKPASLLAPAFLWIQPIFIRQANRFEPYIFGIAVTVISVLFTYRHVIEEEKKKIYFYGVVFFIFLGIINHIWEAIIILPVLAILVYTKRYIESIIVFLVAIVTTGGVFVIRSFGPPEEAPGEHVGNGIQGKLEILVSWDWWVGFSNPFHAHPLILSRVLLLLTSVTFLILIGWRLYKSPTLDRILLFSWLLSGISIPVMLPEFFISHFYSMWALLAPISIILALSMTTVLNKIHPFLDKRYSIIYSLAILLFLSVFYIIFIEVAILSGSNILLFGDVTSSAESPIEGLDEGEAIAAGEEIRNHDIETPSELCFKGEFAGIYEADGEYWGDRLVSRILIYSDILVKERNAFAGTNNAPTFIKDSPPDSCVVVIERQESKIYVDPL